MGIQKDEKPPKKTIPKDVGVEKSIGLPEMSLPESYSNVITPIEVADRLDWTEDSKWPQPKWLSEENLSNAPEKTYRHHYLTLLRSRYWRLEGDFRTFYNNYYNSGKVDFVVARRLIDTLLMSKRMLENDNCDLVGARDLLGVAEQFMVSLYPMHIAKQRAQVLASKLFSENESLSKKLSDTISDEQFKTGELSALLSEITDNYNQQDRDNLIVNSLQVSKLENLVRYGKIVLVLLFITLPLIMSYDAAIWKGSIFEIGKKQENLEIKRTVIAKPIQKTIKTDAGQDSIITEIETTVTDSPQMNIEGPQMLEKEITKVGEKGNEKEVVLEKAMPESMPQGQHWKKWLMILAIGILGGVGAFFSGLMGIRKNKIQLADYQESMTNYLLRIIIGAMASMILFVFITWNAIPGVVFTSAGGILFIAFLSGFSESFFLKQLGVDEGDGSTITMQSGATAPASVTPVQEGNN
jgi:hypothetical protein